MALLEVSTSTSNAVVEINLELAAIDRPTYKRSHRIALRYSNSAETHKNGKCDKMFYIKVTDDCQRTYACKPMQAHSKVAAHYCLSANTRKHENAVRNGAATNAPPRKASADEFTNGHGCDVSGQVAVLSSLDCPLVLYYVNDSRLQQNSTSPPLPVNWMLTKVGVLTKECLDKKIA